MPSSQPKLLSLILSDLWHHKWLVLMFVLIQLSSLTLVYTTHQTRLQVAHLDELMAMRDDLNIEWRHLKIEGDALTEHSRIQYLAKQKLGMVLTNPKNEKVITLP